jgi:hypothetical protein
MLPKLRLRTRELHVNHPRTLATDVPDCLEPLRGPAYMYVLAFRRVVQGKGIVF